MAHNLKRFVNETEYQQATLNYPAVSWVTGTDAVHFDKAAPATNDKVMFAFSTLSTDQPGGDIILWNGGASVPPEELFTDLTVNDVDVMSDVDAGGTLTGYTQPSTLYVTKYGLIDDSTISDIFATNLGGGWGSNPRGIEFFVPSSVTEITSLPDNVNPLVIDNDTVPTISLNWSTYGNLQSIYVPDNAVSAYQTALDGIWAGTINALSDYSGNLPI